MAARASRWACSRQRRRRASPRRTGAPRCGRGRGLNPVQFGRLHLPLAGRATGARPCTHKLRSESNGTPCPLLSNNGQIVAVPRMSAMCQ